MSNKLPPLFIHFNFISTGFQHEDVSIKTLMLYRRLAIFLLCFFFVVCGLFVQKLRTFPIKMLSFAIECFIQNKNQNIMRL